MNIFITGALQTGKSTLLRRVLAELNLAPGGFKTFDGSLRGGSVKDIYIYPADDESGDLSLDQRVGRRLENGACQSFPEVFDNVGSKILRNSQRHKIIIMDEIGFMESQALLFHQAVMEILAGGHLVLGVLRLMRTPLAEKIKNHPQVRVLTLNYENRDYMFARVLTLVKGEMMAGK
jgi:nucleoside-triphosphatase